MLDFTVIAAVSQTLSALLEANLTQSSTPPLSGVPIDLRSPRELRAGYAVLPAAAVSVWLYRVVPNSALMTRRPAGFGQMAVPVPALTPDLYYLLTPLSPSPLDQQILLGRMLETFHDHPVLSGDDLRGCLAGTGAQLRSTLEPLSLEELRAVWSAIQEPFQLSLSYHVQITGA